MERSDGELINMIPKVDNQTVLAPSVRKFNCPTCIEKLTSPDKGMPIPIERVAVAVYESGVKQVGGAHVQDSPYRKAEKGGDVWMNLTRCFIMHNQARTNDLSSNLIGIIFETEDACTTWKAEHASTFQIPDSWKNDAQTHILIKWHLCIQSITILNTTKTRVPGTALTTHTPRFKKKKGFSDHLYKKARALCMAIDDPVAVEAIRVIVDQFVAKHTTPVPMIEEGLEASNPTPDASSA